MRFVSRSKKPEGFTLIEVLVATVVLSLLGIMLLQIVHMTSLIAAVSARRGDSPAMLA